VLWYLATDVRADLLCLHRKALLLITPGLFPDKSFAIHAVLSQWKDLEPGVGMKLRMETSAVCVFRNFFKGGGVKVSKIFLGGKPSWM